MLNEKNDEEYEKVYHSTDSGDYLQLSPEYLDRQ
jgi:hypothetical protein